MFKTASVKSTGSSCNKFKGITESQVYEPDKFNWQHVGPKLLESVKENVITHLRTARFSMK